MRYEAGRYKKQQASRNLRPAYSVRLHEARLWRNPAHKEAAFFVANLPSKSLRWKRGCDRKWYNMVMHKRAEKVKMSNMHCDVQRLIGGFCELVAICDRFAQVDFAKTDTNGIFEATKMV